MAGCGSHSRPGRPPGSLDQAFLEQARAAGATVEFDARATRAERATSSDRPHYADRLVTGFVFRTRLDDAARCSSRSDLRRPSMRTCSPWLPDHTLPTCLFRRQQDWKRCRDEVVTAFATIVPEAIVSPLPGAGDIGGRRSARHCRVTVPVRPERLVASRRFRPGRGRPAARPRPTARDHDDAPTRRTDQER